MLSLYAIATAQPLYAQWNLALLWSSTALCALVVLLAIVRLAIADKSAADGSNAGDWIYALVSLLILLFFGALNAQVYGQNPAHEISDFTLSDFLDNATLLLPVIICYIALRPRGIQRMRLLPACGFTALAIGATVLFNALYTGSGLFEFITESTGCSALQDTMQLIRSGDVLSRTLLIVSAVIIAPIGEECCFRGVLYSVLKRRVGMPAGIALSSLFFGAVHLSLGHTLPLAVFAALLCILYEKTQSLRFCIIAHAVFNSANILVLFFAPSL